jgi:hypothetical protein
LFQELSILGGPSSAADRRLEIILPDGCRLRLPAKVDRRLLADAYNGYDGIAIQSEGRLILVGCGAHLRRRFFAQRTLAPEVACAALSELLPDRWIAAHPQHRLEINRSTGTPVGLEAPFSGADA